MEEQKDRIIEAKCANCGHMNEYPEKDWVNRSTNICKKCGHFLTITM